MLAPRCCGWGRRRPGPRARLAGSLAGRRPIAWSRALPAPAVSCRPARESVFIGARALRSRSEALFAITQYHVWGMKPGRKTKPQAAAAEAGGGRRGAGGGGRGGGRESRAGGGAGDLPAVQVARASCGELVAPRARGSQLREASTFRRRARTGNWGCELNPGVAV